MRRGDCPHCAELVERIRWLEDELGMARDANTLRAIRQAFGISPAASEVLTALYEARGRVLSRYQLIERTTPQDIVGDDERGPHAVDVHLCRIRKAIGHEAVANVWGRGWALTPVGIAKVAAILNAPTEAAA